MAINHHLDGVGETRNHRICNLYLAAILQMHIKMFEVSRGQRTDIHADIHSH